MYISSIVFFFFFFFDMIFAIAYFLYVHIKYQSLNTEHLPWSTCISNIMYSFFFFSLCVSAQCMLLGSFIGLHCARLCNIHKINMLYSFHASLNLSPLLDIFACCYRFFFLSLSLLQSFAYIEYFETWNIFYQLTDIFNVDFSFFLFLTLNDCMLNSYRNFLILFSIHDNRKKSSSLCIEMFNVLI